MGDARSLEGGALRTGTLVTPVYKFFHEKFAVCLFRLANKIKIVAGQLTLLGAHQSK